MTTPTVTTGELGTAGTVTPYAGTTGLATSVVESTEDTAELRFPMSVAVFDRMRKTDGQLGSVLRAITLPIRSANRRLVGDDVRPEVFAFLNAELGLDERAGMARRRRAGVSFDEHLREALLMLPYGFQPFEQVYEVGPPNPGAEVNGNAEVAHLRKLAPRLPRTLTAVRVAPDGGLAGIVQNKPGAPANKEQGTAAGEVLIPVDRLVMYVNDREGAEWTGTSVLRTAYKHWLIKDALLRLGPMVVERNGMGVPVVTYPKGGDEAKALRLSKAFRAGSDAGAALEDGYAVTLVGVSGTTRDELPLVKYHDEATSRSLLAMFLDLGHDNGARALGDTFVDYFLLSLGAVIANVEQTFTEHVIRDLVELNFGVDEPYPVLRFDELSANAAPTAVALKTLADAKLITPGRELEVDLRRRFSLPALPDLPEGAGEVQDAGLGLVQAVGLPALTDPANPLLTVEEARRLLGVTGPGPTPTAPAPAAPAPAGAGAPTVVDDEELTELSATDELTARATAVLERVLALKAGHPSAR